MRVAAGQRPTDAPPDQKAPEGVQKLRDSWKQSFTKLDAERFVRAKAVHQQFDALLSKGQDAFTRQQKLDEAVLLKNVRDEIATNWLVPPVDFSKPAGTEQGSSQGPEAGGAKITEREAAERVLKRNSSVVVAKGRGKQRVTTLDELPSGRIEILELAVSDSKRPVPKGTDPAPDPADDVEEAVDGSKAMTDADFADFPPMRSLTGFRVNGRGITGTGLGFLANCPNLVTVRVDSPMLTPAAFVPLVKLRNLESVHLQGGYGRPRDEKPPFENSTGFASWSSLRHLGLHLERADIADIPGIERARNLRHLDISSRSLSSEFFGRIGKLPDLTEILISKIESFPKDGLTHLEQTPKLANLRFLDCPSLGTQLASIGKMRSLELLVLDAGDAPALTLAAGAPSLKVIEFTSTDPGSDAALLAIAKSFPKLERLRVTPIAHTFTASGVKALSALSRLETLEWLSMGLTDEIAEALSSLIQVRKLSIGDNRAPLTDRQLASVATMKDLESLTLSNLTVTPTVLDSLRQMRSLRRLDVGGSKLRPADVAAIQKVLPRYTVVMR